MNTLKQQIAEAMPETLFLGTGENYLLPTGTRMFLAKVALSIIEPHMRGMVEALRKITEISYKDGIHQWHYEAMGDYLPASTERRVHEPNYYVNAKYVLDCGDTAKQALSALPSEWQPKKEG